MNSFAVIVKSTYSGIEVDSIYQIQYLRYVEFDMRKNINGIVKLMNGDMQRFERVNNIPKGTIERDVQSISMMSLRARFTTGDLILIHTEDSDKESIEDYITALSPEGVVELINKSRINV